MTMPRIRPVGMLLGVAPAVIGAAQRAAVSEFPGPIERSVERDAALLAMTPLVPAHGWTVRALRLAAGPDADLLFPGGPAEMVEAHSDLADRRMEAAADTIDATRVSSRVRGLILLRFEQAFDQRDAMRRGLSLLALPGNRLAATRAAARTIDAIWHAAGDRSADMSWYSKRAILAGVYAATLLFWLRDETGGIETEAFLDRRLAGVARFGKLSARLRGQS